MTTSIIGLSCLIKQIKNRKQVVNVEYIKGFSSDMRFGAATQHTIRARIPAIALKV